MKNYNLLKEVKCPFFRGQDNSGTRLCCEGMTDGATSTVIQFKSREAIINHKHKYCDKILNFEECPLAQAILKKYP